MEPQPNQMQTQNIPASDQITKNKSIYDVSGFEVFWRFFIAGFARAMGGFFVYILLFVILGTLINRYLLPYILPLIETLQTSLNSLNQLNSSESQNQMVDQLLKQPNLQNILNQTGR